MRAHDDVRAGGKAGAIITALQHSPDLDDDELAQRAGVFPRQQVNAICRRLERRGLLKRFTGPHGKIVNRLTGIRLPKTLDNTLESLQSSTKSARPAACTTPMPEDTVIRVAPSAADVLIIVPCSAAKSHGSEALHHSSTLLEELPPGPASRLSAARNAVAGIAHLDESTLMPAWRRYIGTLYQSAHLTLDRSQSACWFQHLLILSGGYGIVRAVDPIGYYEHAMNANDWPTGLLQEVIETYVHRHGIRRVLALVSESTGYARILLKVAWHRAGLSEALLFTPEVSTGAMVKAPRAIGEALATMIASGWTPSWKSSDGLRLLARDLA